MDKYHVGHMYGMLACDWLTPQMTRNHVAFSISNFNVLRGAPSVMSNKCYWTEEAALIVFMICEIYLQLNQPIKLKVELKLTTGGSSLIHLQGNTWKFVLTEYCWFSKENAVPSSKEDKT